mgnify:CR=1 FL=1
MHKLKEKILKMKCWKDPIGSNSFEVQVPIPIKRNEMLKRSYGFFKTIRDSFGSSIALASSPI